MDVLVFKLLRKNIFIKYLALALFVRGFWA